MDLIVTKSEMELIRDHVLDMLDPDLATVVEGAALLGPKWHMRFADDLADVFLDAVASEADHAKDIGVQNALDRLAGQVEKYLVVSTRTVTLPKRAPHPNEMDRLRIESAFISPVPDKIRNIVETQRSGYILLETRPPWRGEGDWTRTPVAKILWSRMRQNFGVYWRRRNKWELVEDVKRIEEAIVMIRRNEGGLFFG